MRTGNENYGSDYCLETPFTASFGDGVARRRAFGIGFPFADFFQESDCGTVRAGHIFGRKAVMIGYICSALADFFVTFARESDIANLYSWSLGSFSGISWNNLGIAAVIILIAMTAVVLGIEIRGGKGIGRVTKPGLNQPVGEHAINSVPRKMIADECENICREAGYTGGLSVVISIPNGEELALKTFNPRMGIEGGLSILGTTGIVEPMSEDALVDTIKTELDIIYAAGGRNILLIIGNYGEAFVQDVLRLSMEHHIKCSNYIGDTLSAAAEKGFKRALLIGHIGKLVKLGIGILNTHSNHGDGRMETLIACALEAGAELSLLHKLRVCVTTDGAIAHLKEASLYEKTMDLLRIRVEDTLKRNIAPELEVGFICFSGMGKSADMEICTQSSITEKIGKDFML